MLERLTMFGINHRLVTFAMLVLITALTAQGLPLLQVDTGLESLISDANPDRQAYLRVAEEFGSDNRTLVYVRDARLWSEGKLQHLEALQKSLRSLELVERVESILTLRTIKGIGSTLDSSPLLASGTKDEVAIKQARVDALANPLIVGNYVSADGSATALMVTIRAPRKESDFDGMVNTVLNRALDPYHDEFDELFQLGPSRIGAELKSAMFEDLRLLAPLSAALLVLTILLFMGSLFAAIIPLLTAGLSLVWTFGMLGHMGIPLNILSAMLPSLIVVIGSTEDTHMIASYFQGLNQARGKVRDFAARFMMRKMGVPLFLTVLTTTLGFASNLFANIELIRDFAFASTFAIVANGIITIALVPLILSLIGPSKARPSSEHGEVPGFSGVLVRVFGYGRQRMSGTILFFTAVLCAFFIYQSSKLYVTNDPFSYFRDDRPLIRDAQKLQTDLAGVKIFFVVLEADDDRAFLAPENIDRLVEIQEFIAAQGIFDLSISLADHLKLVNREFHGGDDDYSVVPRQRDLIAQFLLFFHRQDLIGYISHDHKRANILVRHNISDSRTLNPHIAELKKISARIAGNEMRAFVVGENLMVNAAAEDLMIAQAKSLLVLLVVIFFIMSAMFTSLKGGLVALIPSVVPIVMMFGIMGLLDIPLNPGTAMVAVIAVGIAIDGTVHLFSRYNELCRQTSDNEQAVRITVNEEAIPVIATSVALALGFGVLLFSNFTIIAQFGALSAATMLFAVFANLLITPIIMSRIRLVGLYDIVAMDMQRDVLENSPLFLGMSNYQIRKAILISELQQFAPGELLLEQGTYGRSMYLVLDGEVEVLRHDGGDSRQLALRGAGSVFGEVGYVREIQRTAEVKALSEVQALRFDFERMRKDLHYFPRIVAALNFNISRILGERLAEVMSAGDTQAAEDSDPGAQSTQPTDALDAPATHDDSLPQAQAQPATKPS
ncbi:MAG: putative RND superfamily exporter protein [Gammaproteobacteria bacterium]|jgi:predicted RND superfamily exporter protein